MKVVDDHVITLRSADYNLLHYPILIVSDIFI